MEENFAGSSQLIAWFEKIKRPFPWRGPHISPYAVWVSEVMLQQTRAEVVIPYFLRWMKRFPTIISLAEASEEEVIKVWEGLGYYARARRLLQAARFLLEHHGGQLPQEIESLAKIPGFGPYTVGAVASFAFHKKAPAVDGNVLRFLSRYLLIQKDIAKPSVQQEFRRLTYEMLPQEKSWVVMEAMIELGATVCKKTPNCLLCPVSQTCKAFAQGMAKKLPIKSSGQPIIRLTRQAAVIKCGDELLLDQVPSGQVMGGLYEFPFFEGTETNVRKELEGLTGGSPLLIASFDEIRYGFTRYSVSLTAALWEIQTKFAWNRYKWIRMGEMRRLPFSSGHRRLCDKVLQFLGEESI